MNKFKVDTIEQFKILEYIKQNFEIDDISIELMDSYNIKVIDSNGDSMIFGYSWGKVIPRTN